MMHPIPCPHIWGAKKGGRAGKMLPATAKEASKLLILLVTLSWMSFASDYDL